MKNNKGFVISTMLYAIFGIMLITVFYILYILSDNRLTQSSSINSIKEELEVKPPIEKYVDPSGANPPILDSGMIPVEYDEENDVWVKADETSAWYSYDDKKWANAVTVTSTNRDKYISSNPGIEIPMDDINSMWVWVPRYKYKISSGIGIATYPPKIDIVFESGTETTGVDEAIYRNGISDDGTNENYYTHPAFRNIDNITYDSSTASRGGWDQEITGIWVGKFETGTNYRKCNTSPSLANCSNVYPIIKPNIRSLTYQSGDTQKNTATKFTNETNSTELYGLTNSSDSHMMKNTEWGAVAYLSQSKYGRGSVYLNDSNLVTGRSSGKFTSRTLTTNGTYSYNDKTCRDYADIIECSGSKVEGKGTGASTTGTIYGIYDMHGGAIELVSALLIDVRFKETITYQNLKYVDNYIYTIDYEPIGYTPKWMIILGDATYETLPNDVFMHKNFRYLYRYDIFDYESNNGTTAWSSGGFRITLITE